MEKIEPGAERTKERLEVARRALASLQALPLGGSDEPAEQGCGKKIEADIVRDAAIQRFEYTFEATRKAAQAYMTREGLDAASPRSVIRSSFQVGAARSARRTRNSPSRCWATVTGASTPTMNSH